MIYEPASDAVRPYQTDQTVYKFRFFCDKDLRLPIEKSLPKSNPSHFCVCGAVISVETDSEGPFLRFGSRAESHFAARPRR